MVPVHRGDLSRGFGRDWGTTLNQCTSGGGKSAEDAFRRCIQKTHSEDAFPVIERFERFCSGAAAVLATRNRSDMGERLPWWCTRTSWTRCSCSDCKAEMALAIVVVSCRCSSWRQCNKKRRHVTTSTKLTSVSGGGAGNGTRIGGSRDDTTGCK